MKTPKAVLDGIGRLSHEWNGEDVKALLRVYYAGMRDGVNVAKGLMTAEERRSILNLARAEIRRREQWPKYDPHVMEAAKRV
jgi:hypothetical protein